MNIMGQIEFLTAFGAFSFPATDRVGRTAMLSFPA